MKINLVRDIEKYGIEHTGKALANFVNNCKVTNTKIGTYSSSKIGGKMDVVASGHQIYDMNDKSIKLSPSTVYTFTNVTALDKSPIFKTQLNTKTSKIMTDFLDTTSLPEDAKKELVQKLKDINSRKSLVIPLVVRSEYKLNYEDTNHKKEKLLCKVKDIKWMTNKETYKLECTVCFELRVDGEDKYVRLPITEYIKSFVPDKLEYSKNITKLNMSILKFDPIGIINTIEITDGVQSLVVDNCFVYWLHNGVTSVVGEWDYNTGDLLMNKSMVKMISKTDIYKVFENNINLIASHKNLIAPYTLFNINKINIKEKRK